LDKKIIGQSLYNKTEAKSLKIKQYQPGPGDYNPLIIKDEELDRNNFNFKSKVKRFHKDSKNNFPGPGRYFKHDKNNDKNNKIAYYFREEQPKKVDLLNKFLGIQKMKNFEIPGPGTYNLRQNTIKENKENHLNYNYAFLTATNFNTTKLKGMKESTSQSSILNNEKKNGESEAMLNYPSDINNSLGKNKNKLSSIFLSRSPRSGYFKKNHHVPGPAHYNPSLLPMKSNFNRHDDNLWLC